MLDIIDTFTEDYEFLSNFYEHNGWTVEHNYQAAKTDDVAWRARILAAPTPADAKEIGRMAPIRFGWDNFKLDIMRSLLHVKFGDSDLAKQLLSTDDAHIVEANHHNDTFWGQVDGVGENHLGNLLMEVRRTCWITKALQTIESLGSGETLVVATAAVDDCSYPHSLVLRGTLPTGTETDAASDTDALPHGTISRYVNAGCRCEECEAALSPSWDMGYDGEINPRSGYVPNGISKPVPERVSASAGNFGLTNLKHGINR